MENTGKVLFEDPTPQWFIAMGKHWMGPLSAADVYGKVTLNEISWAHFIWRKGQKNWQRLCETEPFKSVVPSAPSQALQNEVSERSQEVEKKSPKKKGPPAPPKPKVDEAEQKIWYLFFNDTQLGPFSSREIEANILAGKLGSQVFAWKDGMGDWEKLDALPMFQDKLKKAVPSIQPAILRNKGAKSSPMQDKRGTPRKPMVAKIYLSNDKDVATAMCRDISVGGMQVLTDRIPGDVGSKLKLNVSPVSENGDQDFKPFVAEGTIVRILEDGRGFSFRFHRLTDIARKSIESYIESCA